MNPVLLKPESDVRSQFTLHGQHDQGLSDTPWRSRSAPVWPSVVDSLQSLLDAYDVVIIEGAGSPAEINLYGSDFANMRVAAYANASVLLVSDIDRGGAFAHLYGTHQILPPEWRGLISGFVLSKFRGDPAMLAPGPNGVGSSAASSSASSAGTRRCWRRVRRCWNNSPGCPRWLWCRYCSTPCPPEEGPSLALARQRVSGLRVQVVCPPYASNLDEFTQLQQRTDFRWVRSPEELDAPDLVILPGSKNTMAGLAWLHERGLAALIDELHQQGVQAKVSTRPSSACRWRSWPALIPAGWQPACPTRPAPVRVLPARTLSWTEAEESSSARKGAAGTSHPRTLPGPRPPARKSAASASCLGLTKPACASAGTHRIFTGPRS